MEDRTNLFHQYRNSVMPVDRTIDGSIDPIAVPKWMPLIEQIRSYILDISIKINELEELYGRQLLVTFDDSVQDKTNTQINSVTISIIKNFNNTYDNLKKISSIKTSQSDDHIKYNIEKQLTTELNALSKRFKFVQNDHLKKLKSNTRYNILDISNDHDDEDPFMIPLQKQQYQEQTNNTSMIELYRYRVEEENKEIIGIIQSIDQLGAIMDDISLLVKDQGEILDRVDYNIENAAHYTDSATKNVIDVYEDSKEYGSCLFPIILGLVIAIIVVIILIVVKYSSY